MAHKKKKRFKDVSLTWKEGKFFDLWVIVHLLGGASFGVFMLLIDVERFLGYILVIVFALLWELFEFATGYKESEVNKLIDPVMSVIGFGLMYESLLRVTPDAYPAIFIITLIMFALMSLIGWLDVKHRAGIEK